MWWRPGVAGDRSDRPLVFSPFGLGVLDLAVGKHVYDEVARSGELHIAVEIIYSRVAGMWGKAGGRGSRPRSRATPSADQQAQD